MLHIWKPDIGSNSMEEYEGSPMLCLGLLRTLSLVNLFTLSCLMRDPQAHQCTAKGKTHDAEELGSQGTIKWTA